jgi:hypothetical protein
MNAPTTKAALQSLDYHSTATGLASQLQQTSHSAQLMADELARAERIVKILIKYMPASQMIHASLEINEEAMQLPNFTTPAASDVLAERRRQREQEGWTLDHDDVHEGGELAEAAMCYADPAAHCQLGIPHQWPWIADWWKPRDRRHNLVRAGALILAEIERLDRTEVVRLQEE